MPETTAAAGGMTLDLLKCTACGTLAAKPRELCPKCHASGLANHSVEGVGTLMTWTVVRRPPQAFREEGAYAVCVVALDAGVPVTGRLKSLADGAEEPKPGQRVRMTAEHRGAPVFELI